MTFIIMTLLVCVCGWLGWILCRRELEKCYTVKVNEDDENMLRPRPSEKRLLIYMIISTLLNVGLMAVSYYVYGDKVIYALKLAVIFQWIIVLAFIDYYAYIIPNTLIMIGMGLAVCFTAIEIFFAAYPIAFTLKDYFFGFLLGTLVFLLSGILSKGSVGMGDIKLYATLGLLLGWTAVFNLLFFTILVSAIFSIVLLFCKKGNKKTLLPLAPFTYVGMVLILFMGI